MAVFMLVTCMGMIRVVMSTMGVSMTMMRVAERGHAYDVHQQAKGTDSQ